MPLNPGNSIDVGYYLGAVQPLTLSGTAASSNAYTNPPNGEQTGVRVIGNNGFYLAVNAVASTASSYFPPSAHELIHVPNGGIVTVLQANSGGTVWLTTITYPLGLT